jgi:acetolactate decarboxylase
MPFDATAKDAVRGRAWSRRAFVAALVALGARPPRFAWAQTSGPTVRWAGTFREVMRGEIAPRVDMATLAGLPHLYAVGALDGLRGEITVLDGEPSIARVVDGRVVIDSGFAHRSPFLVWAQIERWREVPVPPGLGDLAALERFLGDAVAAAGLDSRQPVPFVVRARPGRVDFHILDRRGDGGPAAGAHDQHAARFVLVDLPVELVGFRSDGHQGVLTHHGSTAHVHVRTADRRQSGHVDDVRLGGRAATLLLPA